MENSLPPKPRADKLGDDLNVLLERPRLRHHVQWFTTPWEDSSG